MKDTVIRTLSFIAKRMESTAETYWEWIQKHPNVTPELDIKLNLVAEYKNYATEIRRAIKELENDNNK